MLQLTHRTWRNIRIVIASLCILGAALVLGVTMWFSWGISDSAAWGAWGKPQTHEEHVSKFWSMYLEFYWPSIGASAALAATGILILSWPGRRQSGKLQRFAKHYR